MDFLRIFRTSSGDGSSAVKAPNVEAITGKLPNEIFWTGLQSRALNSTSEYELPETTISFGDHLNLRLGFMSKTRGQAGMDVAWELSLKPGAQLDLNPGKVLEVTLSNRDSEPIVISFDPAKPQSIGTIKTLAANTSISKISARVVQGKASEQASSKLAVDGETTRFQLERLNQARERRAA